MSAGFTAEWKLYLSLSCPATSKLLYYTIPSKYYTILDVVTLTCNPGTWEARISQGQGYILSSRPTWGYRVRPHLKRPTSARCGCSHR